MIKFLKSFFASCQHNWIVLDKTTVPSRFEILKNGPVGTSCQVYAFDMPKMCYQETQVILTCTKCGKLETKITVNARLALN